MTWLAVDQWLLSGTLVACAAACALEKTPEEVPEACMGPELFAWNWNIEGYTRSGPQIEATCALTAVTPGLTPPEVTLALDCEGEAQELTITDGPMPDWEPLVGTSFATVLDSYRGDVTGHDLEWVALRSEGRLVYASVRAETLTPEGVGPEMFAPLTLAKAREVCPLEPTPELEEPGDGFRCAEAAYAALDVSVAEAAPIRLWSGESAELAGDGGTYSVEVRHASRGENCSAQATESGDTYAFSIVFTPG